MPSTVVGDPTKILIERMTVADRTPVPAERAYLPAMGRAALLPLYDPLTHLLGVQTAHRRLLDQVGVEPGHRVLEIGCGTGNLLLLIGRAHPRTELIGLDPDPAALARARRKAGRAGLDVRLDRGFADELPYPTASLDRVLSALMLHHLPPDEKQRALREVRRVLAPGGALHLLDLDGDAPHGHRRHRARLADNTASSIQALMAEAGFAEPVQTYRGRAPFGHYACYRAHV
jgi:ubiquinone/menaquinone biosynthesis C-methylase UbiE